MNDKHLFTFYKLTAAELAVFEPQQVQAAAVKPAPQIVKIKAANPVTTVNMNAAQVNGFNKPQQMYYNMNATKVNSFNQPQQFYNMNAAQVNAANQNQTQNVELQSKQKTIYKYIIVISLIVLAVCVTLSRITDNSVFASGGIIGYVAFSFTITDLLKPSNQKSNEMTFIILLLYYMLAIALLGGGAWLVFRFILGI